MRFRGSQREDDDAYTEVATTSRHWRSSVRAGRALLEHLGTWVSKRKEVSDFIKELRDAGYEVRLARSHHYKIYDDGVLITTIPNTPSDKRWSMNARAQIRRRGSKPLTGLKQQGKREIIDTPRKDPA